MKKASCRDVLKALTDAQDGVHFSTAPFVASKPNIVSDKVNPPVATAPPEGNSGTSLR